jgi:hypothetical protein
MKNERNLQTVENFVPAWKNTPDQVRVEGIISTYKETHRITDNWPYYTDENGIFIRIKEEKIYVKDLIKKDGYPENTEADIFCQLENWVSKSDEGNAIWVSPSYPGKYPCSKIIFHQVAYKFETMEKVILNSAILFDASGKDTLEFVHQLFPQTGGIHNLEELRSVLILPEGDMDFNLMLHQISQLDENVNHVKEQIPEDILIEKAVSISKLISSDANPRLVAYEMQKIGLLGSFSISCPTSLHTSTSFSELINGTPDIKDQFGSLRFSCPNCGRINTRPFGRLIPMCQHCGADVRC